VVRGTTRDTRRMNRRTAVDSHESGMPGVLGFWRFAKTLKCGLHHKWFWLPSPRKNAPLRVKKLPVALKDAVDRCWAAPPFRSSVPGTAAGRWAGRDAARRRGPGATVSVVCAAANAASRGPARSLARLRDAAAGQAQPPAGWLAATQRGAAALGYVRPT
jgi:hypothetical protein